MRVFAMDGCFVRGGAVALLTIGTALPAFAQGSGTGPARRDTIVRIVDPSMRVRMDSVRVLMKAIDGAPVTSEQSIRLRQELEGMMTAMRMSPGVTRIFVGPRSEGPPFPFEIHTRGYIGITTGDAPMRQEMDQSGIYVQYFSHPAIVSVDRDSPAQLAGIIAGDSLIAYDGVDVVGRTLSLNQMLLPDRKLGITVRRGGENKDYQVTVARPPMAVFLRRGDPDDVAFPNERVDRVYGVPALGEGRRGGSGAGGGGVARTMAGPIALPSQWIGGGLGVRGEAFTLSSSGVFGASMMTLEPVLAKSLKLPIGVLVKEVPEATAAGRAGLLAGDVIVAVGGQAVTTLPEVQVGSVSRAENRTVTFQVVRDRKQRTITITWGAPASSP